MTYKEELKVMSNEELLSDLRFNTEYKLHKKRKDVETELLARLNGKLVCKSCGAVIINFIEGDVHGCIGNGMLKRLD